MIVFAKSEAFECGKMELGNLLNDLELLPEYLADEHDRTEEFAQMLEGIAQVHPRCRYIVEEFERSSGAP